jgi:integrase
MKLITRAGHKPWPRLLHNMRASCATDWAEALPAHVVAKWLGHSPLVAAKHHLQRLQTRDAHFEVAIKGMARVGDPEPQAPPAQATA